MENLKNYINLVLEVINGTQQAGIQNACFSTTSQTYLTDTENPTIFINLDFVKVRTSYTGQPLSAIT